jgi:CRISPR/Cas system-associated protein Csm6
VGSNRETVALLVRLPPDVKLWLEREAARNAASQNSEIVRSIRARMDGVAE